jgi:hypothetical protein
VSGELVTIFKIWLVREYPKPEPEVSGTIIPRANSGNTF